MIFRDVEQKIVQTINESGLSIDAIYYIMKNIMMEIEQKYFEYCRAEDTENQNKKMLKEITDSINKESSSEDKEPVSANDNEEGAN